MIVIVFASLVPLIDVTSGPSSLLTLFVSEIPYSGFILQVWQFSEVLSMKINLESISDTMTYWDVPCCYVLIHPVLC